MNGLYGSRSRYGADYPGWGVELVDKASKRGTFLEGHMAQKMRASISHIYEDVDDEPVADLHVVHVARREDHRTRRDRCAERRQVTTRHDDEHVPALAQPLREDHLETVLRGPKRPCRGGRIGPVRRYLRLAQLPGRRRWWAMAMTRTSSVVT